MSTENNEICLTVIARIYNDFTSKFGIPRQSGLSDKLISRIVFEKKYRNPDALRGIEQFSHLWLLWHFSENERDEWSPTVRPPKLGGNKRMGVFATRSPFRPNPVGMSCVKLERVVVTENQGIVLEVTGADIMNGTPIFDIKPYLPYCDSKPDAKNGFALSQKTGNLEVVFPKELIGKIPNEKREGLVCILSQDPRPAYKDEGERIYVMPFSDMEISFRVCENTLTVTDVIFV